MRIQAKRRPPTRRMTADDAAPSFEEDTAESAALFHEATSTVAPPFEGKTDSAALVREASSTAASSFEGKTATVALLQEVASTVESGRQASDASDVGRHPSTVTHRLDLPDGDLPGPSSIVDTINRRRDNSTTEADIVTLAQSGRLRTISTLCMNYEL